MNKQRVLFLCTGNSARSQMAEAFLRKYGGTNFEPHSAGLEPRVVNPLTVKVMDEVGINIANQKSKGIETYLGKMLFQHLITVCDDADENCPTVWPGINTRMHWSFEDPAKFEGTEEEKIAKFREVRDLIENKIKEWAVEQYIPVQ
ncbi:MAG: arsenate reductase ArsC [Chloroflexi bacterium]|nr:MAG: arsenate reductase ArsC [Chloroflexota bacterium]RPI96756.1 MAG: arsenate reductase ArsC [Chloroflexota bacterium]